VVLDVEYKWLRRTIDDGRRVTTDKLTMDPRKLKNLRTVVSHVSNVNHWMLSHDNIWAALPTGHPSLRKSKGYEAGEKEPMDLSNISNTSSNADDGVSTSGELVRSRHGCCREAPCPCLCPL
jgi:hypothetical protein